MNQKYLTILCAAGLLCSCQSEKDVTPATQAASPLDAFLVSEAPPGMVQISEVFADPTPGKEVVLAGEVMGRMEPFVEGRAIVVLGDPTKLTPCNRIPGDECPTPWDICCDDAEVIKKSTSTIQFLGPDGKVIKSSLKGFHGIKELSYLTVKGRIAEGSNAENLLINAEAVFVTDPSPYKDAPAVGALALDDGEVTEKDGVFMFIKKSKPD